MNSLCRLLRREKQFALKELKLIDCRISPSASEQLLELVSSKCSLQALCLSKAQYSSAGIQHLCTLIQTAKTLTTLDISWCEMPMSSTNSFFPILQAISTNRKLVNLNLSWNNLADIGLNVRNDEEIKTDRMPEASMYPIKCATYLAAFIKYNKQAQHMNLDNCSLTLEMLEIIAAAIRKAPSLQALHLSNNRFIGTGDPAKTMGIIERIRKKIHAKPPFATYVHMPQDKYVNKPQNKHELL
jgi:Ran GTPase-activating protein (RanGAP) involved in mRNA processing and transport